ncbi:hypothetical protein PJL70_29770, partial [Mycobacterium kansasii]
MTRPGWGTFFVTLFHQKKVGTYVSYLLNNPFFGIGLSVLVYGIGEYFYHKTNRFVLFQPLFFGMLLGIGLLVLIAS